MQKAACASSTLATLFILEDHTSASWGQYGQVLMPVLGHNRLDCLTSAFMANTGGATSSASLVNSRSKIAFLMALLIKPIYGLDPIITRLMRPV